ncbi:MAG TPA: T9SS type A sorting domain-containing protein [Caldithrix abyssi]|uniref:T9SS type A sorting domain-containing protein n=1 Tax=Caldithrix abyssi TaxID=187145 RepID=A0A7V4U3R1_CALAY|nr:T9SS type A sorting domain-containing protein [Caldithrix abyssi]
MNTLISKPYHKYFFIFLFSFFFSLKFLSAQVVYTEPPFASEQDSIVVYFDATKGDGGLAGYSGNDVYAHTGVITNYSTSSSDWKHVIAGWNENTDKARLTRVDTDLYKLVIGYPRQYYNMTDADEYIVKLAFVFRNSDGSVTGRDVGGADIFLELTTGFQVIVVQPEVKNSFGHPRRSPIFAGQDDSVKIAVSWSQVETQLSALRLYQGTNLLAESAQDTLYYTFHTQGYDPGFITFTATAEDSGGVSDTTTFEVLINSAVEEATRPAGIIEGINHQANATTITLCLFAPYKEFVYVIGDFNDWKVDPNYYMKRETVDDDSVYWWITLTNLSPGTEYAFQYYVDGEIRLADPYTEKVLDPWNDKYISSSTYPNLKPYPDGLTDQIVSTFKTIPDDYQWQTQDYQPPAKENLVIYELLIRDFIEAHDYKTLIDTLGYLQKLGINAIELTPITEFEGNLSWGYNPSFYFAPDKYYGPAYDLKAFVDSCHSRGMAVILDMVLNHSYGQSPFVRLYNEGEYGQPTAENPWYNVESPNPTYSWGYDFNHESPATQKLVDRINRFWLTEYKVDGFRFDFTKGFTNKPGEGWSYDASRIAILKRMADAIWQTNPNAYVILEHFTENSEERELAAYGMMPWGNSNYNYNEATMGWHDGGKSDFSWGYYGTRNWSVPNLITYMESHDEERLMAKNLKWGNSNGDYDVKELPTALQRMKMAGAFFFTWPGPKMIWQFGELGYDYHINYPGTIGGDDHRTDEKPIRWDYLQEYDRNRLYRTWAALIKLRRENEVFRSPDTQVDLDVAGAVKRIRLTHSTMSVTIVGNFDVVEKTAQPAFQHPGNWYDFFSGDTLLITSTDISMDLAAGEFHIFTDQKLETPDNDLITAIQDPRAAVADEFYLEQNYPNPFNPTTAISYRLSAVNDVELTVYNVLGQKIRTLVNEKQPAGKYTVKFNADHLSSGVYFYRLKAGTYVSQRKMLLLR